MNIVTALVSGVISFLKTLIAPMIAFAGIVILGYMEFYLGAIIWAFLVYAYMARKSMKTNERVSLFFPVYGLNRKNA